MASDPKTRILDCGDAEVDRISNLPRNLIDLILKCLPLRDAARTSILSKTWRDVWGMLPCLVFDDLFFSQLISKKDEQAPHLEASRIVSSILLAHSGPILKFQLFIPRRLPLHLNQDMIFWIKNLSNNGVKKLKIYNRGRIAAKVPSYLFSCLELTHLRLTKCVLSPPVGFRGFCNMVTVKFVDVEITADMSFGAQLDELDLERCTGIEHLRCQFSYNNNLTVLSIMDCREINWQWFECTHKVEYLCLMLKRVAKKIINLEKLVENMPRIDTLLLDGFFLKFLEPGAAIMKRPITMENLERLYLYDVGFYDLAQIQYVLCLIRISPNLQYIFISLERKDDTNLALSRIRMASSVIDYYLHLPSLVDMIFNQLEIVEIRGAFGSVGSVGSAELQFIKLLLASSPSLRRMKLMDTVINDPEEAFRISRELMRFPRASTAAEIIWI